MSRYIPCDKIQKLREAARNGDEVAKRILMAQLDDDADFSNDLEAYFKPHEEQKIEEIAETPQAETRQKIDALGDEAPSVFAGDILENTEMENKYVPSPMHNSLLTGKAQESDNEISDSILNLVSACDKKTIDVANDTELSDATKKGALSILQEIKQSCLENLEKFGKLMSSISKKTIEEEE